MERFARIFPIAGWLPNYSKVSLRGDWIAGTTVGIMLIPQGMAYALLAGLPPIYGLYAAIVPLLVYPIFGSSMHLAVGTMAIDSLIVSFGLSSLAETSSANYIELALVLAVMVGVIHLGMGIARLGFMVNFLSRPVIAGFTSAAALIIGFSQLKALLGVTVPRTEFFYQMVWENLVRIQETHLISFFIGIGSLLFLVLMKRWKPLFPRALTVVSLGTLIVWWFQLDLAGVAIIADIPRGLPEFHFPIASFSVINELIPTAITLALIQFANVAALAKFFAAKHRYEIDPNKELVAIGMSNILGGLFKSFPISGSYSRSAVSDQAGAQTALANAFAALVIVLTLLFLTPLFYYLPTAILAAIIMEAAFGMVDVKQFRELYVLKRTDGSTALIVFLLTLIFGMEIAIISGIAISMLAIFYRISRPRISELGHLPGTRSFRDIRNFPQANVIQGIMVLRVGASLTFANAEYLKDYLMAELRHRKDIKAVLLDCTTVNDIDTTALAVLEFMNEVLTTHGTGLYFSGVHGKMREVLEKAELEHVFGADHFFLSDHHAVLFLARKWGIEDEYLAELPVDYAEESTIIPGIRHHGSESGSN